VNVYFIEIFNPHDIETHVNKTHEGAVKRVADYCRRGWSKHFRAPLNAQDDATLIETYFSVADQEHYEITEKELGA
jgi:hypothetical protein